MFCANILWLTNRNKTIWFYHVIASTEQSPDCSTVECCFEIRKPRIRLVVYFLLYFRLMSVYFHQFCLTLIVLQSNENHSCVNPVFRQPVYACNHQVNWPRLPSNRIPCISPIVLSTNYCSCSRHSIVCLQQASVVAHSHPLMRANGQASVRHRHIC